MSDWDVVRENQKHAPNCYSVAWTECDCAALPAVAALQRLRAREAQLVEQVEELQEDLDDARIALAALPSLGQALATEENGRLKAREAQLEEALRLDIQVEQFDCPHDAEMRCNCGEVERSLYERQRVARDAALASDGSEMLERLRRAEDEAEQLRVQLAGCSVAALGSTKDGNEAKPGDYGHSASFEDVKQLRSQCEKAERERDEALSEKPSSELSEAARSLRHAFAAWFRQHGWVDAEDAGHLMGQWVRVETKDEPRESVLIDHNTELAMQLAAALRERDEARNLAARYSDRAQAVEKEKEAWQKDVNAMGLALAAAERERDEAREALAEVLPFLDRVFHRHLPKQDPRPLSAKEAAWAREVVNRLKAEGVGEPDDPEVSAVLKPLPEP